MPSIDDLHNGSTAYNFSNLPDCPTAVSKRSSLNLSFSSSSSTHTLSVYTSFSDMYNQPCRGQAGITGFILLTSTSSLIYFPYLSAPLYSKPLTGFNLGDSIYLLCFHYGLTSVHFHNPA